jgi:hypothetical protein
MLGILVLLANRAACFQAVDTRRIVLKYCERRAIFCNEFSRRVGIRAKFGVNALSLNSLEKSCSCFYLGDANDHGQVRQRIVDERLSLKVSFDATREMFTVSVREVECVAFAGGEDFQWRCILS